MNQLYFLLKDELACKSLCGSVPRSNSLEKRSLSSPVISGEDVKACLFSKNGVFRGVTWKRRDIVIGILNKMTRCVPRSENGGKGYHDWDSK